MDDDYSEEEVEAAWRKEMERRIADIDEGRVRCIPWEQVRTELRRHICDSNVDRRVSAAVTDGPLAVDVACDGDALRVVLKDGREISVPMVLFPRLREATAEQRNQWRLIGGGIGIQWEAIDEDIAVETLLALR